MSVSLFFTSFYIGLLVPILWFVLRKKIDSRTFGMVPFILLVGFSAFYETVVTYIYRVDSRIWFRVYGLLEFACLYYYYKTLLKGYRKFYYFLWCIYLVLFIYFNFRWNSIGHLKADSYLITIEVILVFASSVFWFKQLFRAKEVVSLFSLADFYFVSGFILYFAGTYVLDLMGDYLINNVRSEFLVYWNLMIVFIIVLRLLILVGIWKKSEK